MMFRTLVFAGFGAAISLAPLSALAEVKPSAPAPAIVTAQTEHPSYHRPTTGSHRSEMRARRNQSRERARAGAEHARKARHHHQ
jgi:hypothetical protein